MKDLEKVHLFNLQLNVFVDKIRKSPLYWYYMVIETNKQGSAHRKVYHSKNFLTLQRHRTELLNKLDLQRKSYTRGDYKIVHEVKPTLLERIRAKKNQKIK